MHKILVALIVVLSSLLVTCDVSAHPPSKRGWAVPADQWNVETQLWLSRAVTAEAGWNRRWKNQREQILLAFILVDRYLIRKELNPEETFVDTIRAYCRGMRKNRRRLSMRMFWLHNLEAPNTHMEDGHEVIDYPITKPDGFRGASWEKHQKYFGRTWVTMGKWAHGGYGHPCIGAKHWGAPDIDPVPKGHVRLACSKRFRNVIYGRK